MDSTMPRPAAPVARSYQDFEPSSEWVRDQTADTLLIHLPGFKKEQIKVQIDSYRDLRTSGESPMNGGTNQWSRFRKDFRIPETLSIAGIRAQFENGVLSVVLPKLTTSRSQQELKPAARVAAEAKPTTQKAVERGSYEPEASEPVPEARRKVAPKTQEQESKVDDRPEEPTNMAGKVNNRPEEPTNVTGKVDNQPEEPSNMAGKVDNRPEEPTNVTGKVDDRAEEPTNLAGKVDDRPEEPSNMAGKVNNRPEEPTNVTGKVDERAEEPTNVAGKVDDRPEEPSNMAGKVDNRPEEPTNVTGKVDDRAQEPTNVAGKVRNSVSTGDEEEVEQPAETSTAAAVSWPEKASWNVEGGMVLGTLRKRPNIRQVVIVAVVVVSLGLMMYLTYKSIKGREVFQ